MKIKLELGFLFVTIFSTCLFSQESKPFFPQEIFPPDSLKNWTKELMTEMSESHPGFYRYTSKKQFDSIIDSTTTSITDSLNTIEFYRKIKPLFAQIGCLHTSLNLSEEYENFINSEPNLIPIEIFISKNNQVFVTKNHSENKNLNLKSEILSINGKPIKEILEILIKSIPSDGYNITLKTLLLNHRFTFWYRSIIEVNEDFVIETKYDNSIETYNLKGITSDKFQSIESLQSSNAEQLTFEKNYTVGILTIKSFAETDIENNGQNFKKYIKSVFKTLHQENIKHLIVDLRYNTGGTDGNAAFFTSHFFDKPFRYWDKIEVTKAIAEQITGMNSIYYPKPKKVDSTYIWKGALLTKEFDYYKTQKPNKNNFKGNVYILTNGLCMSSCSDVVAILSNNKKAIVVGQETGGGFQGNSSGMMPTTQINGNLTFTVPLQKYTNAVDLTQHFGRGTIPDFIINPTLDQWMNKEDVEMNFVKNLIKNEKLNNE
jgi:C-terminal processing protease CtpA/Prc